MLEEKFTKGEWRIEDKRPQCNGFSVFAGNQYIAFVGDSDSVTDCETNAHLIAAAPDMYHMLNSLSDLDECQMFRLEIQELLAKARGGKC